LWVGTDHFRGCGGNEPISTCGALDWLREPKFSYYFFQSQRGTNEPSLFIANYWTPRPSPAKVVVFANCEEVELQLNGRILARQKPDAGPNSRMGDPKPEEAMLVNYMKTGKSVEEFEKMIEARRKQGNRDPVFTGGDCTNLQHAPFTFPLVPFEAGALKAVGYIGGTKVAEFTRRTPGAPAAVRLVAETCDRNLVADGSDALFIRAQITDEHGEIVHSARVPVTFSASGPARLISPAQATSEQDGVATMLLQASEQAGKIRVTATAGDLRPAEIVVRSVD
jgi:beta-galactosidase